MTSKVNIQSYNYFVSTIAADIKAKRSVLLLGAGVSMVKPTALPSGKEMKEIAFESLIKGADYKEDRNLIRKNKNYQKIVPELLFSELHKIIKGKLFQCFKILNNGRPNALHQVFAEFANRYATTILTTNFDLLLDQFLLPNKRIYHLHGDISNIEEIYILLNRIGKGIDLREWNSVRNLLPGKSLFVLGYSGNDKDMLEFINTSGVSRIHWLVRKGEEHFVFENTRTIQNIPIVYHYGELSRIGRDLRKLFKVPGSFKKVLPVIQTQPNSTKLIITKYKASISQIETVLCLIQVHYRIGNYKRLVDLGTKFLRKQKGISPSERYSLAGRLAEMMRLLPRGYHRALQFIDTILLEKQIKINPWYGELLNSKAVVLHSRFDENPQHVKVAFRLFVRAHYHLEKQYRALSRKSIVEKENAFLMLSMVYNNMGLCYYEAKDYDQAKLFFLKSLKIKRKCGHINGQISALCNLCMNAYRIQSKSYLYWQHEADLLLDKYKAHLRRVTLMKDIAVIMIEKGLLSEGVAKLKEALQITQQYIPDFVIKLELAKLIKKYRVR